MKKVISKDGAPISSIMVESLKVSQLSQNQNFLYYKYDKSEMPNYHEYGQVFTEFEKGYATRQINIFGNNYFATSSLKDDDRSRRLYSGSIDDLDLSESIQITKEEFEECWLRAINLDEKKVQINYVKGNASIPFDNKTIIAHIVDTEGKWGKGFVLPLSQKFPTVKSEYLNWFKSKESFDLGNVQFIFTQDDKQTFVANMLAQNGIRKNFQDKNTYLDYGALRLCLRKVARYAMFNRLTIQMPKIGSGLSGGNWFEIEKIINDEIIYNKIGCTVFEL